MIEFPQSLNIHILYCAKIVCIPKNVLFPTAMSKIFSDLYYFVKISVLEIKAVKDNTSYSFDTNKYESQLEVQVAAETDVHKEALK